MSSALTLPGKRMRPRRRAAVIIALVFAFVASLVPVVAAPTLASGPSVGGAASTSRVRIYLLGSSHGSRLLLTPTLRTVPATTAVAAAAVRQLLRGPVAAESPLVTSIPRGTTLHSIAMAGSTATIDLGSRFARTAAPITLRRRLAQLVYTVTQFPTIDTVLLRLDGVPVASFGGISIGGGMHRSMFRAQLPAIFVERPAWGGSLASRGRVTGIANVFEAQFRVRLLAANGRVLTDRPVTASCGTGCWGSFDVTLTYRIATAQWGTLRVYDRSERDGSLIDVRDYPVRLTP
jgi:germination protein M